MFHVKHVSEPDTARSSLFHVEQLYRAGDADRSGGTMHPGARRPCQAFVHGFEITPRGGSWATGNTPDNGCTVALAQPRELAIGEGIPQTRSQALGRSGEFLEAQLYFPLGTARCPRGDSAV